MKKISQDNSHYFKAMGQSAWVIDVDDDTKEDLLIVSDRRLAVAINKEYKEGYRKGTQEVLNELFKHFPPVDKEELPSASNTCGPGVWKYHLEKIIERIKKEINDENSFR